MIPLLPGPTLLDSWVWGWCFSYFFPQSSCLLMLILGGSRWQLKNVRLCHPHVRPEVSALGFSLGLEVPAPGCSLRQHQSSWLLATVWDDSPRMVSIWRVNQQMHDDSYCLSDWKQEIIFLDKKYAEGGRSYYFPVIHDPAILYFSNTILFCHFYESNMKLGPA